MKIMIRWVLIIGLSLAGPVYAELMFDGHATQGGWMTAHETDKNQTLLAASLDDKPLLISSQGYMVFGFGRDAALAHLLKVRYSHGKEQSYPIQLSKRDYATQRVDGIAPEIMEPSSEDQIRIEREAAAVQAVRKIASDRHDFLQKVIWPLKGPVSGVYGSQRIYNGVPKNPHMGLDIAAPRGAWIHAPLCGRVVFAEPDLFYSGGTVIMDHGLGLFSTYIHMDSVAVKVGDELKQGDQIGQVGSKGRASGPHLHWSMNWFEERLDPQLLLP